MQLCFDWGLIANMSEKSFRLRPDIAAMILVVCLFENSSRTIIVVFFSKANRSEVIAVCLVFLFCFNAFDNPSYSISFVAAP